MSSTASTGIVFNAKAIDHTGGVLAKITRGITSVGKIAAGVFAGQMLTRGFDKITSVANELGKLSDVAQAAGVSSNEISKLSAAMNVLGIRANTPEQLATAFQKMANTTGEVGVDGFEKVIASIAKMGTMEERATAAMAVFGQRGMDFLPLIEAAAKNGTEALRGVIETMPGVSDAAADAGDAAADAMANVTNGLKAMWGDLIGSIIKWFDENFEGGIRTASLNAVAYIKYFVLRAGRTMSAWADGLVAIWKGLGGTWQSVVNSWGDYLLTYFKSIGQWLSDVVNVTWDEIAEGGIFGKANERFSRSMEKAVDVLWQGVDFSKFTPKLDDLEVDLQQSLARAADFAVNYSSAAVSISAKRAADETGEEIKKAVKAARADFLSADTYRAATMSIRADYGKGEDKTVKAIDRVKSINEKIQKACEDTASALANVEVMA